MTFKPKIYFTSNVFSPEQIGSNEKISPEIRKKISSLWQELNEIAELKVFDGRFPTNEQLKSEFKEFRPNFIGCHLSHPITLEMIKNLELYAISTSTAGFNHIERSEIDDILLTHTPGVLHKTVADYTIAVIMANLRNLIDLHQYVWNGHWTSKDKWDLDQSLCSTIDKKIVGIVGLGEIGKELVKRVYPWGLRILYHDLQQQKDFEREFPNIEFKANLEDIFKQADIVSIHVPLNKHTEKMVNRNLLMLMKKDALLVNTARGPIVDMEALLDLLEKKEIQVNISFDVFPIEPIDENTLIRLKNIKKKRPEIRMVLIPHNASADADTRGKMDVIFLEDLINLARSKKLEDLERVHLIPQHRRELKERKWKIEEYWKKCSQ
ncbi:MAG: NAD(P)-dependent oxidoreductase [Candidatus Helarchaeota archaeon]